MELLKKFVFFSCAWICLLSSCSQRNESVYPNIEFIYMEKGVCTFNAITDPQLLISDSHGRIDTIITDSNIVDHYINLQNNLESDTSLHNIDIRVVSIIHYNDSVRSIACYGEDYGTMVDGVFKADNPEIFSFLNNLLYDEVGWKRLLMQPYIDMGDKDILNSPEVKKQLEEAFASVKKDGYLYPHNNIKRKHLKK